MGMMIPGRSCRPRGLCDGSPSARRGLESTCRDSASGIALLIFSVAIAGSAFAGLAAYDRAPIADAVVIAAAARAPGSPLATTVAAHALGRGPAWRYAIYGSAARGGGSAILALVDLPARDGRPADRDAGRVVPASPVDGDAVVAGTARVPGPSVIALVISIGARAAVASRPGASRVEGTERGGATN